ncbi:MAG: hypothetical protein E3J72_19415 [Planctomycetota bacterium]|nr:MAG: hypothetical protein E3J72_19415 [Planctomycetota bacterium]
MTEPKGTGIGNEALRAPGRTARVFEWSIFHFAKICGKSTGMVKWAATKAVDRLISAPAAVFRFPKRIITLFTETGASSAAGTRTAAGLASLEEEKTAFLLEEKKTGDAEIAGGNAEIIVMPEEDNKVAVKAPIENVEAAGAPLNYEKVLKNAKFETRKDKKIFKRLAKNVAGSNLKARMSAIKKLASIPNEATVKLLALTLEDPNGAVRAASLSSLTEVADKSAMPIFEPRLTDDNVQVRLAAVRGLQKVGGIDALRLVTTALKDEHPLVRRRAATCLGWSGSETVVRELADLFNDPDSQVRKAAAKAHATIKSRQSVGSLISALSDEDAEVRKEANLALERITAKSAGFEATGSEEKREEAISKWKELEKNGDTSEGEAAVADEVESKAVEEETSEIKRANEESGQEETSEEKANEKSGQEETSEEKANEESGQEEKKE